MIKILLIYEDPLTKYGGISQHCGEIVKMYKNDLNIQITFLCKENIKHHWNKFLHKTVFEFKELKKCIQESNCDIIHIQGFALMTVAQGLRAAISLKKYIIYTAHYHPVSTLKSPIFGKLFFDVFLQPYLSKINKIITINNEDSLFFKKYNSNITMIPSVCSKFFNIAEKEKKENMILFVGLNRKNKGLSLLNRLPTTKYDIHCVIDKPDGVSKNIKIHTSISNEDLDELYDLAALVIVPSKYEAFSIVALEALERGTPVLMSDRVRIADHLDGIDGWTVFKYGDMKDLLNKIDISMRKKVDVAKIYERFSEKNIKLLYDKVYGTEKNEKT
ncbi:hypothetical protein FACS189450_11810 [Spirochaetia bacterium]|nr:hypothetical protein FACS189450_11810 [Spirochaetia bacterium]